MIIQFRLGFIQTRFSEIQRLAVMGTQQQQAERLTGPGTLLQYVPHGEEIAEGFRHLLPIHQQHAVMHPVTGKGSARESADGLRDFVFMMRENQVMPAAMNVEAFTKMLPGHGGAFNMPARPPSAPGAVPARCLGIAWLPQHEIAGIALIGRHIHPRAGQQFIRRTAGKLAVIGEGRDREKHMAIGGIGMAICDQAFDQRDHFRDMAGGARFYIRRQRAKGFHIGMEIRRRARSYGCDGLTAFTCTRIDLVIHIRDVARVSNVRIKPAQQPRQHIKHHHRPSIAQMRQIINRGTTDIEPDMLGIERFKVSLSPRCAVVQEKLSHASATRCDF